MLIVTLGAISHWRNRSRDPGRILTLVVMFIGLEAAGYVALRLAGPQLGLALSGLASGFVSSTGTIATLGSRARKDLPLCSATS